MFQLYKMSTIDLHIKPIGTIKTPFKTKYGAPRQPATAMERTIGTVTLNEGSDFEQALEDLQEFDYIWILFWFHKNHNWKPKVLPPNSGRKKHGVFSTRSPHRPNPIGLSLCRLIEVKGKRIKIENPDMLDGTPILDIKPYIPYAEAFPDARSGWIHELNENTSARYNVTFASEIKKELLEVEGSAEIIGYVKELLSRDPYPHPYRRIKILKDGTSVIAVKRWRLFYRIEGMEIRVVSIICTRDK